MRRTSALAALALLASIAIGARAGAQSCPCTAPSFAAGRRDAVAIFEARVVGIDRRAPQLCGGYCPDVAVRMRASRRWKGTPPLEVVVRSESGNVCDARFADGETYLVYASAALPDGSYVVHGCTRTRLTRDAAQDLRALGAGRRMGGRF